MFIFEAINQREIDRFVFGGYALDQTLYSSLQSHLHSEFALAMMERNVVGELDNRV
jgi:hypothetical protein